VQPLGSSQHVMEPEGSLLHSQELSNCNYPLPDQSSPQHSILSLKGASCRQTTRSGPPALGLGVGLTTPHRKKTNQLRDLGLHSPSKPPTTLVRAIIVNQQVQVQKVLPLA
jgi:hypothetical protein